MFNNVGCGYRNKFIVPLLYGEELNEFYKCSFLVITDFTQVSLENKLILNGLCFITTK